MVEMAGNVEHRLRSAVMLCSSVKLLGDVCGKGEGGGDGEDVERLVCWLLSGPRLCCIV